MKNPDERCHIGMTLTEIALLHAILSGIDSAAGGNIEEKIARLNRVLRRTLTANGYAANLGTGEIYRFE